LPDGRFDFYESKSAMVTPEPISVPVPVDHCSPPGIILT
jgi:hypothetical protein